MTMRIERTLVPYGRWSPLPDLILLQNSDRPPTPGELVGALEIRFAAGSSGELEVRRGPFAAPEGRT